MGFQSLFVRYVGYKIEDQITFNELGTVFYGVSNNILDFEKSGNDLWNLIVIAPRGVCLTQILTGRNEKSHFTGMIYLFKTEEFHSLCRRIGEETNTAVFLRKSKIFFHHLMERSTLSFWTLPSSRSFTSVS